MGYYRLGGNKGKKQPQVKLTMVPGVLVTPDNGKTIGVIVDRGHASITVEINGTTKLFSPIQLKLVEQD